MNKEGIKRIYNINTDGRMMNKIIKYVNNRSVLPHNPYLLLKFNCHINDEVCSTVQCVKY